MPNPDHSAACLVCESPTQAIALRHTRDEQLNAAGDGLLEQVLGRV